MKRLLVFILLLVVGLCCVGCSKNNDIKDVEEDKVEIKINTISDFKTLTVSYFGVKVFTLSRSSSSNIPVKYSKYFYTNDSDSYYDNNGKVFYFNVSVEYSEDSFTVKYKKITGDNFTSDMTVEDVDRVVNSVEEKSVTYQILANDFSFTIDSLPKLNGETINRKLD